MSRKSLATVVLGMALVVASVAWRNAVQSSGPAQIQPLVMVAQGGDPVPPNSLRLARN